MFKIPKFKTLNRRKAREDSRQFGGLMVVAAMVGGFLEGVAVESFLLVGLVGGTLWLFGIFDGG